MMIVHDLAVCDFPEVFGIRQIPELMAYLDYYVIANAAWMSKLRLQLIQGCVGTLGMLLPQSTLCLET
jgi:hypothetical protein